jgi:hypothetical protein
MSLKKEFRDLRQKYCSVSEYNDEFTNLSWYAPDDIDTDAKRKEKFLEGLNDELSIPLSVAYTPTFQSLTTRKTLIHGPIICGALSFGAPRISIRGAPNIGAPQISSYPWHTVERMRHG